MEPRTRRNMIRDLIYSFGANSVGAVINIEADTTSLDEMKRLRPPGAGNEAVFRELCTKCGDCVQACPYTTLKIDNESIVAEGYPYFEAREMPCYMCDDTPCISSCATNALGRDNEIEEEPKIYAFNMGLAIVDSQSCLAFDGVSCDACFQECPLKDAALSMTINTTTVESESRPMIPLVNAEHCTGCGQCESACVAEDSAIYTLSLAAVEQGFENLNRKKKRPEHTLCDNKAKHEAGEDSAENVLAYLNQDGELFD